MIRKTVLVATAVATGLTLLAPAATAIPAPAGKATVKNQSVGSAAPKARIPYTQPTPPAPIPYTPGMLTFQQFNVCKSQCDAPAPSWDARRERVQRVINETGADVVGVNEATNWEVSTAKTQWLDIQELARGGGYVATKATSDECERPRDANGRLSGTSPCDHTTGILYKASTVREVSTPNGSPSSGATTLGKIAPGIDQKSSIREVNWAYLQAADGSTPVFLAVSAHFPTEKDATRENARVAVANNLGPWSDNMNQIHGFPGAPVVLMADLNSYQKRQPNGAQKVLTNNGWVDAWNAPERKNDRWSTINKTGTTNPWDEKPYFFYSTKNPVTRIDYIMGRKVTPVSYETVIWLTPDGKFIPEYQASDHQSIRATLKF